MALHIENRETESLAQQLALLTGESVEEATQQALRERLERAQVSDESLMHETRRLRAQGPPSRREQQNLIAAGREAVEQFSSLPVLDDRSPDELLGYGEDGLPR